MFQFFKLFVLILFLTLIGVGIYFFNTYQFFEVRGDSMLPTYQAGQIVLVRALEDHDPRNLTVVYGMDGIYRIKRVIGVQDDEVLIREQNVYVNGNRIHENYLMSGSRTCIPSDCSSRISRNTIVPKDSFFVLGDNREASRDSRECAEGIMCEKSGFKFIPKQNIVGRIVTILPSWVSSLLTSQKA